MKAFVLGGAAWFGLALAIYAQTPAATPETPAPSPAIAATATSAVSVSPAISATPSAPNQFADKIKERFGRNVRIEGLPAADWVLIDADDVIVHIFRPEVRNFYNLERMWAFGDDSSVNAAARG